MTFDATDWTIAANGDIRYTGDAHGGASPTYATVLELHRALQDFADDATASGDDLLDISDETPSDRSTDNIISLINSYNIDDTAAEHLYDGSITQDNGDTVYSGLVVVGSAPGTTELQIVQNNALLTNYWGTGLNTDAANNILLRIMVKTRTNGVDIDGKRLRVQARELGDSYAEFSLTAGLGNSTAAIFTGTDLNNATAAGTISGWTTIANTEGYQQLDINGDTVNEDYYAQWDLGSQSINDLYERTKWIQRRGTSETIHGLNGELFRGITHEWPYDTEGGVSPATNDDYAWGLLVAYDNEVNGPFAVGDAVTIGTTTTGRVLMVDDDGLTGSLVVAVETNDTPADNDQIAVVGGTATADVNGAPVGQATGGGVARILAVDDNGTTGTVWVQLLKGSVPTDNTICYGLSDVADVLTVNGSITSRTVSPEFIGASTGSALIGAFGIAVEPADTTASDQFFDLTNTLRVPPNNVTFTVGGLISGEDRVLVGPESGGSLQKNQFTLNTALIGATETAVVVNTTIPSDTPSTGTIRVVTDGGIDRRLTYTSYTSATFTIPSTSFTGDNASVSNNVYITYIDELASGTTASFTSVYSSDRGLFIRVRDGDTTPIKTFETTGTLGSAGGTTTAIRTSDA